MGKNTLNSLMPLWLFVILKEKSSAQNPLSRNEIEKALTAEYKVSIGEKDRNKTKRYINALCEYFKEQNCDGVVVETEKQVYYENVGMKTVSAWYLDSTKAPRIGGNLSVAEVDLLTDMVNNSQIISSECTAALIHKLAASLSEGDRKEIRKKELDRGAYKNENKYLFEIRAKAEEAIDNNRQLTITYEIEGVEDDFAITPLKIDCKDGKCFILGYRDNNLEPFFFDNIRFIELWKEELEHLDEEQTLIESEDSKKNKTIALDALFTNTRIIRTAINNKQYISFSYCSYTMQDNKVRLTQSEPQNAIPIKTAYKGGKPYLIAIDPQNHQPVFFRIDLMKDISPSGHVDFMEYRKFDVKDSNEYTDKHPFMLSGFTKIRATFLIKADSLDRVVDAFGNKATFIGQDKAFESAGENASKLARAYPELNFSHYLGFDHNETLVKFTVETTDEEAVRFALQNGDVAELESPAPLRDRILDIVAKMEARHKKVKK